MCIAEDVAENRFEVHRLTSVNTVCKPWKPAGLPVTKSNHHVLRLRDNVRRGGKLWIKIFPHKPLSKQPAETRMGKGKKGPPEHWVAVVKPGRVLFELSGVFA